MKHLCKSLAVSLLAIFILSAAPAINAQEPVNQGLPCTTLNKVVKINGVSWQCIKLNDQLIWNEKLTWGQVSVFPGQVVEGYHNVATGITTLVPTVITARLGSINTDYKWRIKPSSVLPPGFRAAQLSQFGVVSGQGPIPVGTHHFTAQVNADSFNSKSFSYKSIKLVVTECNSQVSIEEGAVNALCPAIVLNFPPVANYLFAAKKGQPYALSLFAQGGLPPYKWEFISPKPAGINLNINSGVLYGLPKTSKIYTLNVRITDKAGTVKTQYFKFKVTA